MATLKAKQRATMGANEFAVPGKRMLPIHDATHIKLAWDMVDRAKGLTSAERASAKRKILAAAKKHGIDTSSWKGADTGFSEDVYFSDTEAAFGAFAEGSEDERTGFFVGADGEKIPWIEKRARLFHAGTHKGHEYTEAHLDRMADSFAEPRTEKDWSVPLQLGHTAGAPSAARDTTGNVRKVWRQGAELWGVIRAIGKEAVEKVASGLWRRLSIEHRPDLSLKAVAITPFPHLRAAQMFSEGDKSTMARKKTGKREEEPEKAGKREDEEPEEDDPEEGAEPEGADADDDEDDEPKKGKSKKKAAPEKKGKTYSEDPDVARAFEEFQQRLKRVEERNSKLEESNAKLMKERSFAERSSMVAEFTEEGRTLPAFAEQELAFAETLSDEQLKAYRELKAKQPKFIDFGRRSVPHVKRDGEQFSEGEVKARADEMWSILGPRFGDKTAAK